MAQQVPALRLADRQHGPDPVAALHRVGTVLDAEAPRTGAGVDRGYAADLVLASGLRAGQR